MMLRGQIRRSGRWWTADVPAAGVYTQGRTRKDARAMIADALESIIDHRGFKVRVGELGAAPDGAIDVIIEASKPSRLAAYVLRYQREKHGISRDTPSTCDAAFVSTLMTVAGGTL